MKELPVWMQGALPLWAQQTLQSMDLAALAATICCSAAVILGLAVGIRALKRGWIAMVAGLLPMLASLIGWRMDWPLLCWAGAAGGALVVLLCVPALRAVSKQREEAAANRRARAAKHRAEQAAKQGGRR